MASIDLQIPEAEAGDIIQLLDAVRNRLAPMIPQLDHGIFVRGLDRGVSIEVVHPVDVEDLPEHTYLVRIDYEGFRPKVEA
jgi:hypothetical protein